ncbi:hypothetical protein IWW50_006916, partial [Coemansia erecta]
MAQGDWDTDSDYRQFSPGLYAMRQLGRSVSRHTRRVLQPGRGARDEPVTEDTNGTGDPAHEFGGDAPYRRGPPMPSGIHRRSRSFDNLVLLPGTMPRRSTDPAPASPRTPLEVRLPAASTWNSGTTATRAAHGIDNSGTTTTRAAHGIDNSSTLHSANPDSSMRR